MISIATSVGMLSSSAMATAASPRIACSVSSFCSPEIKSLYSSSAISLSLVVVNPFNCSIRRGRKIYSEVTVRSDSETSSSATAASAAITTEEETDEGAGANIGARVRVTVPLKVYHVSKLPDLDLIGMEGVLKQYVGIWKGKRISANLPYKVEFVVNIEGRPPVKFLAHLKEDEFEYI